LGIGAMLVHSLLSNTRGYGSPEEAAGTQSTRNIKT
jgi:hypothetical protein